MPPIDAFLQYGALGLLAIVLIWAGRLSVRVVDRLLAGFDQMTKALQQLNERIEASNKEVLESQRAMSSRLAKVQLSVAALRSPHNERPVAINDEAQ